MNFNQPFGNNPRPLTEGIERHIENVVGTLYNRRQIDQITGQNLANALRANINNIETDLRRNFTAYNQPIQDQNIENMVVNYASALLNQQNQYGNRNQPQFGSQQQFGNQPQFGNQLFNNSQIGGFQTIQQQPSSLTSSYLDKPGEITVNNQSPVQPEKIQQPVHSPKMDNQGKVVLALTGNPHINFNFVNDKEYLKYSTTSKDSGAIVDVTSKAELRGSSVNINYSSVDCRIIEPSVGRVIDNFIDTNPPLLMDNFIVSIDYQTFILKRMKYVKNDPIDLSILDQSFTLPISEIIKTIVSNIETLAKNKADMLQFLIINEFNDLAERYIRLNDRMGTTFVIEDFNDFFTLINPSDRYKDFAACPNYLEVIGNIFKESVKRIIFKSTQTGCFETTQIAPELITSPKFVIRANGLYERESDFTDQDMINAIQAKYTAFGRNGNIVITNFMTNDLEDDLNKASSIRIQPDRITNPLEYLIFNVWKNKAKTILVYRSGKPYMVIKNGMTLNDQPFIFQSDINLSYGL